MPLRRRNAAGKIYSTTMDLFQDRLTRWSDIQEYLPYLHATALRHPRILELGSRTGVSTIAFLAAAEQNDGSLTSVDLSPSPLAKHPQWTFIQGDDTDPEIISRCPPQVDLLFIDTSHYYEHTLQECRLYVPLVAPGGVVLFHDTHLFMHPHEYEWHENIPPVWKALDAYCAETGLEWRDHDGSYGLGEIRVG